MDMGRGRGGLDEWKETKERAAKAGKREGTKERGRKLKKQDNSEKEGVVRERGRRKE